MVILVGVVDGHAAAIGNGSDSRTTEQTNVIKNWHEIYTPGKLSLRFFYADTIFPISLLLVDVERTT